MVIMLHKPMPFLCQTHLWAPRPLFEVYELDHREGNHVDIQIKSQQHPPPYQLKKRTKLPDVFMHIKGCLCSERGDTLSER